ncbi:hypothetical protein GJ496_009844 [Pomphorhynchus laevis]|nr:hypothetical protein GJ496_009844 [Pomphorhynchus laevis]
MLNYHGCFTHQANKLGEWQLACILSNCMMGVSIVAMPQCFRNTGILFSTLLLFKRILKVQSYDAIAGALLGKQVRLFVQSCVCLMLIGLVIAYQTAIRSLLVKIFMANSILNSTDHDLMIVHGKNDIDQKKYMMPNIGGSLSLCILTVLIAFPLSLSSGADRLGCISYCAIILYGLLAIFICLHSTVNIFSRHLQIAQNVSIWCWEGMTTSLPIFLLGMCCHPWVVSTLDTSTSKYQRVQGEQIIDKAIILTASLYWIAGVFGCLGFEGSLVPGDYLFVLDKRSTKGIVELIFIVTCLLSIPLLLHPCRILICSKLSPQIQNVLPLQSKLEKTPLSNTPVYVTAVLLIITTSTALLSQSIEKILCIVGSILSSFIALIFPAMFSIAIQYNDDGYNNYTFFKVKHYKVSIIDAGMLINGCILIFIPIREFL